MYLKFIIPLLILPFTLFSNPVNTELGKPTGTQNLEIIEHFEFSSGFSCDYGIPLWVSYNLNKDWFGDVPRWDKNFMPDSSLPQTCWIRHSDYTNSGYDRGHMVRSEERTRTAEENRKTFLTSNVIPQLAELNQQTWLKLEYYAEKLAKDSLKEMFIYTGPIFTPGKEITRYKDKIAIPDSCYKIIVVMPYGSKISDVTEHTQIIACIFPNNDKDVKNHDWTTFNTTVAHIEESTGFDFLSALPKTLQDKLEGRPTSVNESSKVLFIYPNPATDYVNIPFDNYEVYNSLGVKISSSKDRIFNTSDLPNGVYFVRTESGMFKFVK
jgi:endonuclease G